MDYFPCFPKIPSKCPKVLSPKVQERLNLSNCQTKIEILYCKLFLQQYIVVHTLSPREALFLQVPRWELRFPPPPSPLPQFALHSVSQGPQGTDGKILGKRILTNCSLCQLLDHDKDKNILAFPMGSTEEMPQIRPNVFSYN